MNFQITYLLLKLMSAYKHVHTIVLKLRFKKSGKICLRYLVVSEFANNWFMQEKADVLEQVEGPWGCGTFVHLLLVLGLMRVDAFEDTQASEKKQSEKETQNFCVLKDKASCYDM